MLTVKRIDRPPACYRFRKMNLVSRTNRSTITADFSPRFLRSSSVIARLPE